MTLSHPERIDSMQLQTKHTDTAEHFEFFPENLLHDVRLPLQHASSGHSQYPYMTRYNPGHCTTTASVNPCGIQLAKISTAQPNVVSMSVPVQQAVLYPGYSNCAVYPAATRGSFSCLNRNPSDASEHPANDTNSEDNPQDSTPNSQTTQREVCRYFMRTGTCGYGDRCRYHHPQSAHRPRLNSMGYPLREAEHACPFYLKNGWCGFGATCKFNHPELPPLNVPVTTMMPQVLTHISYSTVPQYATVAPSGAYQMSTPAPVIHHWPVPGVAMNAPLSNSQQNGQSRPYVPATATWQSRSSGSPPPVERYGVNSSDATLPRISRKGTSPSVKDVTKRRPSPGSEDSAYSTLMGQDVSFTLDATLGHETTGNMSSFRDPERMKPRACP